MGSAAAPIRPRFTALIDVVGSLLAIGGLVVVVAALATMPADLRRDIDEREERAASLALGPSVADGRLPPVDVADSWVSPDGRFSIAFPGEPQQLRYTDGSIEYVYVANWTSGRDSSDWGRLMVVVPDLRGRAEREFVAWSTSPDDCLERFEVDGLRAARSRCRGSAPVAVVLGGPDDYFEIRAEGLSWRTLVAFSESFRLLDAAPRGTT